MNELTPYQQFTRANVSTLAYEVFDDHPDWSLVAALDESESYEVDVVEVWRTADGFAVLRATGCSCWGGEYASTEYPTLDAALADLTDPNDKYQYNPSLKGAEELRAAALAKA
jgi:hypothetical protein